MYTPRQIKRYAAHLKRHGINKKSVNDVLEFIYSLALIATEITIIHRHENEQKKEHRAAS